MLDKSLSPDFRKDLRPQTPKSIECRCMCICIQGDIEYFLGSLRKSGMYGSKKIKPIGQGLFLLAHVGLHA